MVGSVISFILGVIFGGSVGFLLAACFALEMKK